MIDDNDIDLEYELKKSTNELVDLRQKYIGLQEDWDYMKSLLDKTHDKNCKLKKENEQLKQQLDEMITIFENSGLDYHISDELNEILNR